MGQFSSATARVRYGRCEGCRFWKHIPRRDLDELGMCQSPGEAKTRGADKGVGWRDTLGWRVCDTKEFEPIDRPNPEAEVSDND